ncbi:Uncharacterized protein APZ42_016818 [Daphnia magna]|uniref:Uncharacterized protein n=1 Tax=Daphnia magna TaxID=35525 RepID=A0A165A5Z1_9CRUS|nr:Uncharacterized protein APZ42_016818 [Daphnia magna]
MMKKKDYQEGGCNTPPGQFNSRAPLPSNSGALVLSRWEQTISNIYRHAPFSIYKSAVYINRMKCLPNKKVRETV